MLAVWRAVPLPSHWWNTNQACCAATVALVEHESGLIKGLLTSKSTISKRGISIAPLELISGHMAAHLARNICHALKRWPVETVMVWMDSMVALYWILNPGKSWKVFVANRVRKIAQITEEVGIQWKYCPTERNLADIGSRGASLKKMENCELYEEPQWLLRKENWPEQPNISCSSKSQEEERPVKEIVAYSNEQKTDEWDELLARRPYWKVLRITAWVLRFKANTLLKSQKAKKVSGPLHTAELKAARDYWVRKVQRRVSENMERPGWKLVKEEKSGILKCAGRISGYNPTYLEGGPFVRKLIQHVHTQVKHLGIANTMAALREECWIPRLRALVKKLIRRCNVCKVFAAKPLDRIVEELNQIGLEKSIADEWRRALRDGRRYFKTEYQSHCQDYESQCPDHCRKFGLSDPNDLDFQEQCTHQHTRSCPQCEEITLCLEKIHLTVKDDKSLNFYSQTQQDDLMYDIEKSSNAIVQWKAHKMRSVNQESTKQDILTKLDQSSCLIVMDWATKFLQLRYREKQGDWYGKRGLS